MANKKDKSTTKTMKIGLPLKVVRLVEELIKEGDYKNMSDFLTEASRSHLNTWYGKRWNPEESVER